MSTTGTTGAALVPGLRVAGGVAAAIALLGAGIALTIRRSGARTAVDEPRVTTTV
ncbi:hypothetical protein [Salinispora arenicola]|uniref:Uncharacterized protein n=1 Tax=Salinispora arenicola (strain CNS-205) TaxID=391037 RepID=A8LWE9_SALAI|nr:hypothetical protein [Salinispora arenicola]MCN0180198.1 hypothetical protein [Salinispora arenicola]